MKTLAILALLCCAVPTHAAAETLSCDEARDTWGHEYLNFEPYACDFTSGSEANCYGGESGSVWLLNLYDYTENDTTCVWSMFRQDYEDEPLRFWRRMACDRRTSHPHDCWTVLD